MNDNEPDHGVEFDCIDCGLHVICIVPPPQPRQRCAGCQWLADLPNEADREGLRKIMLANGTIGTGED